MLHHSWNIIYFKSCSLSGITKTKNCAEGSCVCFEGISSVFLWFRSWGGVSRQKNLETECLVLVLYEISSAEDISADRKQL